MMAKQIFTHPVAIVIYIIGALTLIYGITQGWFNKKLPYYFEVVCDFGSTNPDKWSKEGDKYYLNGTETLYVKKEIDKSRYKQGYDWYKNDKRGDGKCKVQNEKFVEK